MARNNRKKWQLKMAAAAASRNEWRKRESEMAAMAKIIS
jgi:hypothetical protein